MKSFLLAMLMFPAVAFAENPDSVPAEALREVVVTGSNRAVDGRRLPYTVSVIGRAELESAPGNRVLDVLDGRVPSFFVTQRSILGYGVSSKGGAGHIKLRGVGGDRASGVLMMVDGQPMFAGIYSHHVGDFYTKGHVERVEVLRGPGSVLYGSNAMAGVVNIVTKTTKENGFHGSLSSEYGSRNTWMTTASGSWRKNKAWAMASVSYDRTDGTVRRFDFNQVSAYAKAGYDFSQHWKGYADYTFIESHSSDPIYPRLSNPESEDIYEQNVIRGEASVAVTNRYDNTDGAARLYYSYGNHYIDDPRHFHSTDDRLGFLVYQNFALWQGANGTGGFDFVRYTGSIPMSGGSAHKPGAMATFDTKIINEYSPYLTLTQSLCRDIFSVSGGVRVAMSDIFGTRVVPQGGVRISLPHAVTLKGSVAMGYRNPSFRELYLYKFANPELKPERMMNYEINLSKRLGATAELSLTAYYIRGYDMIQQGPQINENTGRFINKGIEATANWHMSQRIKLWGSYSYLHTSLNNLTGAPRHQYFIGADYMPSKKLSFSASVNGVSRLYVADNYDLQSYAVVNVKANWQLCRSLALSLRLDNVTDARYTINSGYRMPGFCIFGGFELSI